MRDPNSYLSILKCNEVFHHLLNILVIIPLYLIISTPYVTTTFDAAQFSLVAGNDFPL